MMGQEVLDHCRKVQSQAKYWCFHGVSDSIPCPDCFRLGKIDHPLDRTRDWERFYAGGNEEI